MVLYFFSLFHRKCRRWPFLATKLPEQMAAGVGSRCAHTAFDPAGVFHTLMGSMLPRGLQRLALGGMLLRVGQVFYITFGTSNPTRTKRGGPLALEGKPLLTQRGQSALGVHGDNGATKKWSRWSRPGCRCCGGGGPVYSTRCRARPAGDAGDAGGSRD